MLDSNLLAKCVERFSGERGLVAVWILGSAVSDRLREDSDVDFALYYQSGTELGLSALGELACDLEDILGRRADLGCLSSRNLVYAMQAFHHGRLLYAADEQAAMAFAGRLLSLYLDLKQDRKVVEEAYCA